MNPEIINRVINLIDRNNERVVLVDPETGRAVVVMDLDAYEEMSKGNRKEKAGLSEIVAAGASPVPEVEACQLESPRPEAIQRPIKPMIKTPEPKGKDPSANAQGKEDGKIEEIRSPYPPIPDKKDPLAAPAFTDLTQSELLDKINRDIASWKTVQERKREGELAKAAQGAVRAAASDTLEEEEHFYLEPVE